VLRSVRSPVYEEAYILSQTIDSQPSAPDQARTAQRSTPPSAEAGGGKRDVARDESHPISPSPSDIPASIAASPRSSVRWWLAVLLGSVICLPFAWLLSYGAALPFFLGLFFFVLFGLMIGAAMHRVAAPGRPYGRMPLVVGTSLVVGLGWGISIVKEAVDFPADIADDAITQTLNLGDRTPAEYRAAVSAGVRTFLKEHYAPGGPLGYVRWILTDGTLDKTEVPQLSRALRRSPNGWLWVIRVVLSIALFGFGIGSQTLPLKLVRERSHRAIDEKRDRI